MRSFPYKTLVSVLVAALMLAGNTVPYGVRHAHANGDRPHQHDSKEHAADHRHEHDHPSHSHHHGHSHEPAKHDDLQSAVVHTHFCSFGFHVSLPAPVQDEQENDSQPVMFVRLFDDGATEQLVRQQSIAVPHEWLQPLAIADVTELDSEQRGSPPITTPPLCDRARFERSGVLLC